MKGLLFTPEMARAVIAGRKTQTRRVVPGVIKPCRIGEDVYYSHFAKSTSPHPRPLPGDWCQYQPGEKVCLLTTWAVAKQFDDLKPTELSPRIAPARFWHAGMGTLKPEWAGKSRPGRFLPNKLRHLMPALEIVDVDVQRVREITEEDAKAEGVVCKVKYHGTTATIETARIAFRSLWNSINAERGYSWARNPQVFVITFREELPF